MYHIILTSLLSLPVFPLNPTQQDTLSPMSFHLTAGVASPNEIVSVGPELTFKYEFLFSHPYVLRTGLDYRFGRVSDLKYPNGDFHGLTTSFEALYYRGTNRMTGFIGVGLVYNKSYLSPDDDVADSLLSVKQISEVSFDGGYGYRFILGLRRSKWLSFELRITDIRTKLVYRRDLAPNRYSLEKHSIKLSDFRVSFGFLLPIRKL